ncbi:conserved hypothetical protein [Histoplasma capsulatum var. duboisii H88]|uniref:Glycosyl hydrolase catalytic core domain-containing protein n=2 Tax=Ajellomyces capsulatus TaxID=5037 RepID=F0UUH6_AJEC8|nr:conserved hypothetical protein [Histoplasma capsulatum H143]EGC49553.1 conserved hypothetical protein [Histoplasma capsulatum var. duboisii H88]QSS57615.1 glycosyl hydrolase catalytic core domain-containing protein [Histoplasma capsulatum var. duboisii H88]
MVSLKSLLVTSVLASAASCAPSADSHTIAARSGSGKRGLAYNNGGLLPIFLRIGESFSWSYNWNGRSSGDTSSIEFVPMLWGARSFGSWYGDAEASLASGSKNLLAFNEPDILSQANMTPEVAAQAYMKYMNQYSGRARLGSPAVSNGGPPLGLGWMKNFLDICGGKCKIDFLAVHWHGPAGNVDDFKRYISNAIALAKNYGIATVWVTEFGAQGDEWQQVQFLKEVLPWLDNNAGVERYAYFFVDTLARGGSLSSVGQVYSTI